MTPKNVKISSGGVLSLPERYLERALHYYTQKQYDDALLDLNEALKLERRNAELYATRGIVYIELGQEAQAETDFSQALQIDPHQWVAHYGRAMLAFTQKKYDSALEHLNAIQRIAPMRPELFIYRAATYYYLKEKDKAKQDIDAALQAAESGSRDYKLARKWRTAINKLKA